MMDKPNECPVYGVREEIAHSITHGIGIVLGIAGLAILTAYAARYGEIRHIVSGSIFGAMLIVLYSASTLYHSIRHPRAKRILRICDHCSIYLLIAGTYTPFTLVCLQGVWGWSLFGLVWCLTALGIALQFTPLRRIKTVRVVLYLTMGWAAAFAIKPLIDVVPMKVLILIIAGGIAYTSGIAFYLWRRLPYHHAIWHVFVLSGSILHFLAVFFSFPSA
jgi:hemolysin III